MLLICCLIIGPNYTAINFIKRNSYHCSAGGRLVDPRLITLLQTKATIQLELSEPIVHLGEACFPRGEWAAVR